MSRAAFADKYGGGGGSASAGYYGEYLRDDGTGRQEYLRACTEEHVAPSTQLLAQAANSSLSLPRAGWTGRVPLRWLAGSNSIQRASGSTCG